MNNKTTMPDPVAHMTPSCSRVLTDREARSMQVAGWDRNKHLEYYSVPLISVADAEAPASARVKEALEEAINLSSMYGATIELDAAIRALIPMENQK